MRSFTVFSQLIVLVFAASAFAAGPPPEALAACQNKSVGTTCSFTGRRGENLTGTCKTPDSSKPVACCPNNGPHSGGGGQPPGGEGQSQNSGQSQN